MKNFVFFVPAFGRPLTDNGKRKEISIMPGK